MSIWASTFVLPSDFRQSKHTGVTTAHTKRQGSISQLPLCKGGCLIRGNRNRRGEWIYHLPGMPYYEQTRAEEMFCTEAQALAAGYRRAKVQ